jgi:hypothetical protein
MEFIPQHSCGISPPTGRQACLPAYGGSAWLERTQEYYFAYCYLPMQTSTQENENATIKRTPSTIKSVSDMIM